MKYPIEAVNFAGRLVPDDLTVLNEAIPLIIPETVDINDDKALTGRVILMSAVEKSLANVKRASESQPKDLEQIAQLEEDMKKLAQALGEKNEKMLDADLEKVKLTELVDDLNKELRELREAASESTQRAANLEKYKPVENEMRIVLPPFTREILVRYARKVSKISGKDVQAGELLVSLFNRYITSGEVELDGFPLLISKKEMKSIHESLKQANEPTQ